MFLYKSSSVVRVNLFNAGTVFIRQILMFKSDRRNKIITLFINGRRPITYRCSNDAKRAN